MANKWEYSGDIDVLGYGGVFLRHVGDRRYHAIRFDNMEEHLSEAEMEGVDKYHGSLVEVDLDQADLEAAVSCCGAEDEDNDDLALAFMVVSYGQYAPLQDEAGNNGNRIIRNLKRESRELEADSDRYEALMDRPVNAIGSTAREFQAGDLDSALQRGLRSGNEAAGIMAVMSKPRQPVSLGRLEQDGSITGEVSVDMSLTGSDDPLAFAYGFSQGIRGEPIATEDDLAEEYVRGHAEGTKVYNGGELPSYAKRK